MIDVKETLSGEKSKNKIYFILTKSRRMAYVVVREDVRRKKGIFVQLKCRARKPRRKALLHMTSANIHFRNLHCN